MLRKLEQRVRRKLKTKTPFWRTEEKLRDLTKAIIDNNGIGMLNLMLKNAGVMKKYNEIFYRMHYGSMGDGAVCIDCGAHAGLITDIFLHCGAISYSFEPNIYLHAILKKKYKDNPNVNLYNNAVADSSYTTKFLIDSYGVISEGNRIVKSMESLQEGYEVQVIDLCKFIESEILPKHERIYFLKLDIEGAEFGILDRIIESKLYEKIDFIACETHERFFPDGDAKMRNLHQKIVQNNITNIFLDWI